MLISSVTVIVGLLLNIVEDPSKIKMWSKLITHSPYVVMVVVLLTSKSSDLGFFYK